MLCMEFIAMNDIKEPDRQPIVAVGADATINMVRSMLSDLVYDNNAQPRRLTSPKEQ